MNPSEMSRRSLFGRLFGGLALAVGASAAIAGSAGDEPPTAESPQGIASYTFDDEGRLLSITHDGVTRDVLTASLV